MNEANNGPALVHVHNLVNEQLSRTIEAIKELGDIGKVKNLSYSGQYFTFDDQGREVFDNDWCYGCGDYLPWFKAACGACNTVKNITGTYSV